MEDKSLQFIERFQEFPTCRPLSSWEQQVWLCDQVSPTHFAVTAQIKGEFSVEQLKQALAQLQQRHPLLRVRIALDEVQQPWFVENTAKIPLRVLLREGEQHWEREVERELSEPFVWSQAPLVRVVLLHSTDISELIVTCHHSIADGMSSWFLIRDIFQILATDETFFQPLSAIPTVDSLILRKVDQTNIPLQTTSDNPSLLNQGSGGKALVSPQPKFLSSTGAGTPLSHIRHRVRSANITPETTKLLASCCHQEQTTVHGAICAAFLLAIAKRMPLGQNPSEQLTNLNCFSAINIRQYLMPAVGEDVGYYVNGKQTRHSLSPNATLWEVAHSVKQQLKQEMVPEKIFSEILYSQESMATNPSVKSVQQGIVEYFEPGLAVSNMGCLKLPQQLEPLQLEAIYGPVGITPWENKAVVGAATVRDQLFLTLAWPDYTMSTVDAEKLLQEAIHLLNTAIK